MEQLNQRKGKITEARVSAILGNDSLRSRQDVMRSMVREWFDLTAEDKKKRAGHGDHEQLALAKAEFEAQTGMVVSKGGFYTHANNSLFGASIFGFLSDDHVDIICCQPTDNNTIINAQEYLRNHRLDDDRIQFQLHCTNTEICHFIVKTPQGIDSTAIVRDDHWMKINKSTLNHFISEFLTIVNSDKLAKPYLTELEYNASEDSEWLALAQERLTLKNQFDELNKTLKDINNQLIAFAKKKDCKVVGGGIKAFKATRKGAVQYAKIPELKGVNMDKYRKKDVEYWSIR